MEKIKRAYFIFVLLLIFGLIAERLLFILFPIYLIEKQFSATEIGVIFSISAFFLIISRTFIGRLSDKYGRKMIMSFGLLIESVSIFFYSVVSKLYEFVFTKTSQEIGRNFRESVEDSVQADSFPRKLRVRYLTKLGTILPLGRVLAMVVGFLIISYLSITFGFYIAAISVFASFLIFLLFYQEKTIKSKEIGKETIKFSFHYSENIRVMAFAGFIGSICFAIAYFPAFFILVEKILNIPTNLLFLLFLIAYIFSAIFTYFLGKKIDEFGRMKTLIIGFFLLGLTVSSYILVQDMFQLLIVLSMVSLCYYIWRIAFKTAVMDMAKQKTRGEELGFVKTLQGVGDMIGPVIGGILIDIYSIQLPFLIAGALYFGITLILLLKFLK